MNADEYQTACNIKQKGLNRLALNRRYDLITNQTRYETPQNKTFKLKYSWLDHDREKCPDNAD